MSRQYPPDFLRKIRNEIPIDTVIISLLKLDTRMEYERLRFRCPLCHEYQTSINPKTNLARCFDCKQNFNPIDIVITVDHCGFIDAVEVLKKTSLK